MVDCSCCYTIRRDVSLSCVSSSSPSPHSDEFSFNYLDYLILVLDRLCTSGIELIVGLRFTFCRYWAIPAYTC
jgi:hypothetical protein